MSCFRVTGLKCIIITDREGVPLLKLAKHNKFPELGTRQPFLSTFSVANEQASKIGLGRNESIISIYNNHQVRINYYNFIHQILNQSIMFLGNPNE